MKELEAQRIASALHDGAGQLLASVHIAVAQLGSELPPSHGGRLNEVRSLLDEAEQQLRRLSHELRPPLLDDMGLAAALDYLVEGFTKRTGIRVTVESLLSARLPVLIETTLYRVVSEALTNVRKHAQATAVHIRLRRTSYRTACLIQDDGVGFRQRPMKDKSDDGGLGMLTIQERLAALNGRLRISSRPGRGTLLAATIPCASEGAPGERATFPLPEDYGAADSAG
jgi:signal transduction histidine kinase